MSDLLLFLLIYFLAVLAAAIANDLDASPDADNDIETRECAWCKQQIPMDIWTEHDIKCFTATRIG